MERDIVTSDLSRFGYIELEEAKKLLDKVKDADFFTDGVHIEFNTHSGSVFLVDEDYNVGLINDDNEIEQWITCPDDGEEGFISELKKSGSKSCKKFIKQSGY
jgi:hypothetical protein